MQKIFFAIVCFFPIFADAALAGGRPNSISGGQNAFAGVVNPANAVWIEDRFDLGGFWVNQKSTLNNKDNNPRFAFGKTDLTYKAKNLFTADFAIHKHFFIDGHDSSISFAAYSMPNQVKLRTKEPIPVIGNTSLFIYDLTRVFSAVFSIKLDKSHSIGVSADYFYFTHERKGFQNSDNSNRSVAPGHVTNNGKDHSSGLGCSVGWRFDISKKLTFGLSWIRKSHCGQYKKYKGYEPHRGKNYIPQLLGGGFNYKFTPRLAGRLEVIWTNTGNIPNSNNNFLPNGQFNPHKRGSKKSPGPGLQDTTFINAGLGYGLLPSLSLGIGFSHRFKFGAKNFLSRSYRRSATFNLMTFGANFKYEQHDLFLTVSHGFKNHIEGSLPPSLGADRFSSAKNYNTLSLSWGYRY